MFPATSGVLVEAVHDHALLFEVWLLRRAGLICGIDPMWTLRAHLHFQSDFVDHVIATNLYLHLLPLLLRLRHDGSHVSGQGLLLEAAGRRWQIGLPREDEGCAGTGTATGAHASTSGYCRRDWLVRRPQLR